MTRVTKSTSDDELRKLVRDWLQAHWNASDRRPRDAAVQNWVRVVFDAGWSVPTWPVEWYGCGLTSQQAALIEAEFACVHAPGAGLDRFHLAANTVLTFGQDVLKREVLRGLVVGELKYCLLYSEPGAGSDLAALRTRADREDDHWLVTGQKVWTSGAQTADFGLLLARTDWSVPKHQGISFFCLPMKQSGIEVRPIRQITGDSHFNEVFLDSARVPATHLLGQENAGWKILQTALAYERLMMGEGAGERRVGQEWHASQNDNSVDLLSLARTHGCHENPWIRQEIARALGYRHLNALNTDRAKAELTVSRSSSLMSLGKLAMSRILHEDARVMTSILGASSLLDGPQYPDAADVNYRTANAYMTSIGGGTDQIQRNIIAERVLGLPREVEVDRNVPFGSDRNDTAMR